MALAYTNLIRAVDLSFRLDQPANCGGALQKTWNFLDATGDGSVARDEGFG